MLTLFALVFVTLTTFLSFALGTKLLRAVAALLLLVAASCGFFMTQYGVVIDQSMIRNAVETTVLEATPLLSGAYFWHVALYGVLPATLVFAAPLARLRWQTELFVRLGTAAVGIALLVDDAVLQLRRRCVLRPRERRTALADQPGLSLYGPPRPSA